MRQLSRIFSVIIILGAFIVSINPACAGPHLYAGKRKKINCGVLVIPGATQPLGAFNVDGGVGDLFFLLEIRTDLKPTGWTLENPLAPGSAIDGYTKNTADYWQVNLTAARDLSSMHILYLPASGMVTLSRPNREKLRRFVDGGGVLWIDNTSTTSCLNFDNTFFIQDFLFKLGTPGTESPVNRHHPLISLPYWLNDGEVSSLGYNYGKCYCMPGFTTAGGWGSNRPVSFDALLPVINSATVISGDTHWPSLAASAYGSGRIVASANYVGRGCFLSFPYDQSNLKFVYNVMAWASSWTHLRKDPRHSGSSIDTVGGTKLVKLWSHLEPPTSDIESAPVIYKNLVFYSSGNRLYALDLMPQEDLDQNGNPDDGLQDMTSSNSQGRDIVWMWSAPGKLSSPTLVTAQDPKSPDNTIEAVLVMSSDGKVFMLDAFPRDASNNLLPTTTTVLPAGEDYWDIGSPNSAPSPPLYVNGWIYAVNDTGYIYAYNPSLKAWNTAYPPSGSALPAADKWTMPVSSPTTASAVKSGLSYGLIKNENNDAIVGMLYWSTDPWMPSTEQNDHICSIPIFVSNDRLKIQRTNTDRTLLECKVSYPGSITKDYPAPVAWIESSTGASVIECHPNENLAGASAVGSMVVKTNIAVPSDATVYATYGLEYALVPGNLVPQPVQPPSNTINLVPKFLISGTPSMSNDNMIFASTTHETGSGAAGADLGGAIFGLRNDSSGNGNTFKWIYYLHQGAKVPFTSGASGLGGITIPGVVVGEAGGLPISMKFCQPYAPPVVTGDKVIAAVTGDGSDGSPMAAILCFKANPDFVIRITQNAGYGPDGKPLRVPKRLLDPITNARMRVKIWQPNLLMGYTGETPSPFMSVTVPQEMIDYGRGTITFNEFSRLKLMSTTGMLQTNAFSPSLPVWVFLNDIEVPIDFSTWSTISSSWSDVERPGMTAQNDAVDLSGWNNLLWYYVVPDESGISSAPVVIGNTIYFVTNSGMLFALNSETGETASGPTSQKPIWQEKISSTTATSFSNTTHTSIAGANGVLLVPAPDGLHAYSNATTLVADSDRLVELDGAGEIGWSLDSIEWPVALPSSTSDNTAPPRRSGPISKPASARYVASGNILLVNTGANQVCMIGRDGNVVPDQRINKYFCWMFDKFADPNGLLRSGQPTTLSSPTDALLWQEIESNGTTKILMIHCLIADSGNNRIIDLVYRINPTGASQLLNDTQDPASGYYLPELNWITKTDTTNERYVFNCIQLVPNISNGVDVWAAVSNYGTGIDFGASPSATEKGLGGAIVALRYRVPAGTAAVWNYASTDSGRIVAGCDKASWNGTIKPLAAPRFFQILNKPDGRYLLICDNYGVYKVALPTSGSATPSVITSLKDEDYRICHRQIINDFDGKQYTTLPRFSGDMEGLGVPLMATSVQELPNGNWLIANGYSGTNISGTNNFVGEVFEYDPLSASDPRIKWNTPSLRFTDSTVATTPEVDWLNWRQASENASIIQQPKSALRQF